jgi:hypothetical protein
MVNTLLHRQFLVDEIPVFFRLFVLEISVSIGFPAQGSQIPPFFDTIQVAKIGRFWRLYE